MFDMLHIILTILKIAGILLAVLLLILLILLLTVLFLPIRYRAELTKDTSWREAQVHAKIRWLSGILACHGDYEKGSFTCYLSIFHKKIWLVGGEEKETSKKHRSPVDTDKKTDEQSRTEALEEEEDLLPESVQEEQKPKDTFSVAEKKADFQEKESQEKESREALPESSRLFRLQKKVKKRLQSIKDRIQNAYRRILKNLRSLKKNKETLERYLTFFRSDLSRDVFQILKEHLHYLLFHMRPRRITGRVHYGFSDPAYTGEFTGILYLLLPAGCAGLKICPDFEEQICEGDIHFSGHIRIFHITKTAIKIFFDKKLKLYWKRLKQLRRA